MSIIDKIPEWIDRFNNNELEGDELRQFLELLQKDPRLRDEVRLDKELNEALEESDLLELREKILGIIKKKPSQTRGKKMYLMAAILVLFIVLAPILYFILGHKGVGKSQLAIHRSHLGDSSVVHETMGTRQIVKEKHVTPDSLSGYGPSANNNKDNQEQALLAENFKPLPSLESLVGMNIRSKPFHLVSPAGTLQDPGDSILHFRWKTRLNKTLILQLMNNRGHIICTTDPLKSDRIDIPIRDFTAGLYYFKFTSEGDILFLGKIKIKEQHP